AAADRTDIDKSRKQGRSLALDAVLHPAENVAAAGNWPGFWIGFQELRRLGPGRRFRVAYRSHFFAPSRGLRRLPGQGVEDPYRRHRLVVDVDADSVVDGGMDAGRGRQ